MSSMNQLDADELLYLAIEASNKGDNEKSIILLKQALENNPKNANVQYMLGAIHAQIGMYDRAIEDMQKAIAIDPNLMTAHFQLGLLYITSGNVTAAEEAWSALDSLGEENALFLFKRGILSMARDKFEECIADLQNGIKRNTINRALNRDMQMLISQAQEALKNGSDGTAQEKPKNSNDGAAQAQRAGESHVFASAYENEEQ